MVSLLSNHTRILILPSVKRDRHQSDTPPIDPRDRVLFDHFVILSQLILLRSDSANHHLPFPTAMTIAMSDPANCLRDPIVLLQAWMQMKFLDWERGTKKQYLADIAFCIPAILTRTLLTAA